MWNEFPNDEATYRIQTQFMVGSALLVAPKLSEPTLVGYFESMSSVDYFLPSENVWYTYYDGKKVKDSLIGTLANGLYSDYD